MAPTAAPTLPEFPLLISGHASDGHSDLDSALAHMRETLERLQQELPTPFGPRTSIHTLFGPYLARSILEVTCTALIARSDPFRILTLRQVQSQSAYEPGVRSASSIHWTGDILAEKNVTDPWSVAKRPDQMTRALLGDYQEIVLWKPAFTIFLDAVNERTTRGAWTRDLQQLAPERFVGWARQQAAVAYSQSSKGIHHEFVVKTTSYYDDATLRNLVENVMMVASTLAVVFNFSSHPVLPLEKQRALDIFESMQP
jgi:hypothetical protein